CVAAGLDVENGLHVFLGDDPELSELAAQHDVELRDLRRPPPDLSTATGANLDVPATIVLTVGSDCAIGKTTVALELDPEAPRRRGRRGAQHARHRRGGGAGGGRGRRGRDGTADRRPRALRGGPARGRRPPGRGRPSERRRWAGRPTASAVAFPIEDVPGRR